MRIFSGRVPAGASHVSTHRKSPWHDGTHRTCLSGDELLQVANGVVRAARARARAFMRARCAPTLPAALATHLHLTLTFFPKRSLQMTSIIVQAELRTLRVPAAVQRRRRMCCTSPHFRNFASFRSGLLLHALPLRTCWPLWVCEDVGALRGFRCCAASVLQRIGRAPCAPRCGIS